MTKAGITLADIAGNHCEFHYYARKKDNHLKIALTVKSEDGNLIEEVDLYSAEGYKVAADLWLRASCHQRVMYEPTWMGIPIIQYPTDMVMMQELIWKIRPDYIIETGVAHGGSCVLHASILELIGKGQVIGIDVEIRKYNETAIKNHPMAKRIHLIEGSSIDPEVIKQVRHIARPGAKCLVVLDSNHSYQHVKKEIELYQQFVGIDCYMVVMDGAQEWAATLPNGKPEWAEDNPLRAIREFVTASEGEWVVDEHYSRMKITSSPMGFLKRRDMSI
ncbi:cephalosporin hydroxylase family protein [Rheinheimera texasensis]|uniref:cephalosporin hydroxylase family protein n=1 Tax=Rheinheimera texasensis TaxID=306205 RepID=UPI0012FEA613|nr:CmcI family methyltransferase [Rheinheimera texasensis]